jgi:hypothetical protein
MPQSPAGGELSPAAAWSQRAYTRPWARFLVEPAEAVSFVMSQKMLRGIRDRAEQVASARAPFR